MQIEKLNINLLKVYENNAKLHPKEHIEQIKKSIKAFGNNDPIAIDQNNVIIEGHGRFEALKQLGYTECEVIRLTHLTEEQKKAYILAHNKLTMNTGFDIGMLQVELGSILDIEMADFGFDILNTDDLGDSFTLSDSDKGNLCTITFSLAEDQLDSVKDAITQIKNTEEYKAYSHYFNDNTNGNALYLLVTQWLRK